MRPELIVAGKEFRDHVTSRRFIVIFAVLLLISAYSIVTGMDQYNKSLDMYKENQQQDWYQQQIKDLQTQIQKAQANGDSQELIDSLQAQLDSMINPWMPSVMSVFYNLMQIFVLIGIALGIALGFDLITREKEEGSLKSLLSHPVYRDSVINGKTIGAITVLATSMGAMFLITIAIMLFFGVIPSGDDFLRIVAFFVMAMLFCLAFFAVAMAASTLAKNSSMAVLYALGIVMVLWVFGMYQWQIVDLISGPAPETGPIIYYNGAEGDVMVKGAVAGISASVNSSDPTDSSSAPDATPGTTEPAVDLPRPIMPGGGSDEWQKYYEKREMIRKAVDAISPISNFQNNIATALISDTTISPLLDSKRSYYGSTTKSTVWDAIGSVWVNILVLIAEILAAFAVAYVKFLRADIR
jgi:ABC-2 type transport system permease protein